MSLKNAGEYLPDENIALMNGEGYSVALDFQILSCPGWMKETSVRLKSKSAVPTVAAVHISWTQVVQRLRCEAVCFIFIATAVVVALVWRVWYKKMPC
jgi:hypothetical protein